MNDIQFAFFITLLAGFSTALGGLIVFVAALYKPALGIAPAVAIAIHNIPEGIAVAVPIRFSTGSKWKALRVKRAVHARFMSDAA